MPLLADGIRFAIVGGVNTVATFLLYQLLVTFIHPVAAYWLVWIIGIVFLIVLFPSYVYKGSRLTRKNASLTAILYLSTLAVGTVTLQTLNNLGMSQRLSIIFVLIITSTLNFVVSRYLFRGRLGK